MSHQDSDQEYSAEVFANLAPQKPEQPFKKKNTTLSWLNKKPEGGKKHKKEQSQRVHRERSRSRQRREEGSQSEESMDLGWMSLNYRQRRRVERLFTRGQREYREGKNHDRLSYTLFNTIEQYFK